MPNNATSTRHNDAGVRPIFKNIKRLEMLPGGSSGCSRSDILKLFDSLDTKLDGHLDAEELTAAFSTLGSTISHRKLKAWICCITEDRSEMVRGKLMDALLLL